MSKEKLSVIGLLVNMAIISQVFLVGMLIHKVNGQEDQLVNDMGQEETVHGRTKWEIQTEEHTISPDHEPLPQCPEEPPGLFGQIFARHTEVEELEAGTEAFNDWFSKDLGSGGTWRPSQCSARQKVAIVVPYRERPRQLRIFLHHIHPILQRQQLDYRIVVVEQSAEEFFNRGALLNIGYVEALKYDNYDCVIFHDVDLLAEDDRNLYMYPKGQKAKHMSVTIDKMDYRLLYDTLVGGVFAMSTRLFKDINGFTNARYGWGGEDDDLYCRMKQKNISVQHTPGHIGKFSMVKHNYIEKNAKLEKMMKKSEKKEVVGDGLSTLKYDLLKKEERMLYTWVLVRLPKGPLPREKDKKKKKKAKSWLEEAILKVPTAIFGDGSKTTKDKENLVYL